MSAFQTPIPVDVAAARALLPAGAFIEGVDWDKKAEKLVLKWSHHRMHTGYTFHVEYTMEQLRAQETPESVKIRQSLAAPPPPEPPKAPRHKRQTFRKKSSPLP